MFEKTKTDQNAIYDMMSDYFHEAYGPPQSSDRKMMRTVAKVLSELHSVSDREAEASSAPRGRGRIKDDDLRKAHIRVLEERIERMEASMAALREENTRLAKEVVRASDGWRHAEDGARQSRLQCEDFHRQIMVHGEALQAFRELVVNVDGTQYSALGMLKDFRDQLPEAVMRLIEETRGQGRIVYEVKTDTAAELQQVKDSRDSWERKAATKIGELHELRREYEEMQNTINRALEENRKLAKSVSEEKKARAAAEEMLIKEQRANDELAKTASGREQWGEGFCAELDAALDTDSEVWKRELERHRQRWEASKAGHGPYWAGAQVADRYLEKFRRSPAFGRAPTTMHSENARLREFIYNLLNRHTIEVEAVVVVSTGQYTSAKLMPEGDKNAIVVDLAPEPNDQRLTLKQHRWGGTTPATDGRAEHELGKARQFIDELLSQTELDVHLYRDRESREIVRASFRDPGGWVRELNIRPTELDTVLLGESQRWLGGDPLAELEAGQAVAEDLTAKKVAMFLEQHPPAVRCGVNECELCAWRDCPHSEVLHYHHDGCPACSQDDIESASEAVRTGARETMSRLAGWLAQGDTRFKWGAKVDIDEFIKEALDFIEEYWRRRLITAVKDGEVESTEADNLEEMPF